MGFFIYCIKNIISGDFMLRSKIKISLIALLGLALSLESANAEGLRYVGFSDEGSALEASSEPIKITGGNKKVAKMDFSSCDTAFAKVAKKRSVQADSEVEAKKNPLLSAWVDNAMGCLGLTKNLASSAGVSVGEIFSGRLSNEQVDKLELAMQRKALESSGVSVEEVTNLRKDYDIARKEYFELDSRGFELKELSAELYGYAYQSERSIDLYSSELSNVMVERDGFIASRSALEAILAPDSGATEDEIAKANSIINGDGGFDGYVEREYTPVISSLQGKLDKATTDREEYMAASEQARDDYEAFLTENRDAILAKKLALQNISSQLKEYENASSSVDSYSSLSALIKPRDSIGLDDGFGYFQDGETVGGDGYVSGEGKFRGIKLIQGEER